MLKVEKIIGNIFENPELAKEFESDSHNENYKTVSISRYDLEKTRLKQKASDGTRIGISLDGGTKMTHGDVFYGNDVKILIRQIPEQTISVRFAGLEPKFLVLIGHIVGNLHRPVSLEADSIGEGFGDYLAGSLGAQFSGGFQDVCIAEWDATSYSSTIPPCLRRLDGTKHYPEAIVGEVHDDGEIWSAALWQIRTAIGATKADRMILQHHFLLTSDTTFNQAANALVTAAINLKYHQSDLNAIRTILQNRGFTVTMQ
ncbi:MAG: hypothetical protein HP494_09480 [Nitrospira sp.]|nr:hypothetical protein [Nitrospira sp.]